MPRLFYPTSVDTFWDWISAERARILHLVSVAWEYIIQEGYLRWRSNVFPPRLFSYVH